MEIINIMPLKLAYFGNPILRKRAEEIKEFTPELKKLIEEMVEMMHTSNGVGIAAPQVHHSIRLFITANPQENEEGEISYGKEKVYINPVIKIIGDELQEAPEGCLSIPDIKAPVMRPMKLVINALDENGKAFEEHHEGYTATVMAHENDHLNGVLFVDRISKKLKNILAVPLRKLKKKMTS